MVGKALLWIEFRTSTASREHELLLESTAKFSILDKFIDFGLLSS